MRVDYEREGPTHVYLRVVTVSHTSCRAAWNHCRGFVSHDGCVRAATASPDRRARGTEYSSIMSSIPLLEFCFSSRVPTRPIRPRPSNSKQRRSCFMDEPTCYDATSGPGTRRRVCPSARSPTGGPARGRGPGGAAVASSGDNAFVLRGRGRPARLVGAYSVATPAAGRTTVHEGPRDPYDYRTTSVYPNAKQDAYYREFVSHLSQPICPCAPGRETESTPHRSRHTVRRPRARCVKE